MSSKRGKADSEEENASEASHDARLKQLCLMVGVAIMHDVRMVVREELERVGLTKEAKVGDLHDEIIGWREHLRECNKEESDQ
tara:strand:- start:219 stop:467 length:249 start_codon:yes stop_codon:yes gene_type:complete